MSKNISFIYFDLGGVMFRHGNALETLAKEYGITVKDFDKVFKRMTIKYQLAISPFKNCGKYTSKNSISNLKQK